MLAIRKIRPSRIPNIVGTRLIVVRITFSLYMNQLQHDTTIRNSHADRAGSGRRCKYANDKLSIESLTE
jgi:hypothetical protein